MTAVPRPNQSMTGPMVMWLEPTCGALSLRWAIIGLIPFDAWSSVHLSMGSAHYRDEAGSFAVAGKDR